MHRATVLAAKALIVVLLAALLGVQVWVVPSLARSTAAYAPEFAQLVAPGIALPAVFVLCIQIVLVCVWRLLSMVREESIFRPSAFVWVDVILGAIVTATLLVVIGAVVIDRAQAGTPLILIGSVVAVIFGAGLALVMVVLRGLLQKATQLESDLSEVV
ncbi:DUF2975 domain-containing protein [Microbacterium stercoris]|uniref:DUF2975 domain-containing protein n=1 Tax=Microbacterium stercoris TaxID=2820289 RepID=A0A939QQ32_9MICO|nr:DUF2975 domain-containing protein [Microbacterium stercoris]MBO3662918.1 DUF2975 domain-containing protein [Microbacterium stercoris]